MSDYVEEKEFTLRLAVRYSFPETYEGEKDGYAWVSELASITQSVVQAALQAISKHPGWAVRPGNRGRPSEEEITLVLERIASD